MLEVRGISAAYGHIRALAGVSLTVPQGGIVALLGSNGAGKTTTLNVVSRLVRPTAGEVKFEGAPVQGLSSDAIVARGLVQVPEGREVFREMSVRENLLMGAYLRRGRSAIDEDLARIGRLFPRLQERMSQRAATLSGGEQQMLAIGRAMMARPKMILFDEPSMGLSPVLVDQIFDIIGRLNRDEGITVLLVEQNAKLALAMSSYAYILENGEIVLEGESSRLACDPAVRQAYLGA
ncbi:MAG: ABC transporter ATP-binding protein [Burkholderiales bacterium]|nr:ABC transporter ATP-binding protein [Burkholderiales bacterium]